MVDLLLTGCMARFIYRKVHRVVQDYPGANCPTAFTVTGINLCLDVQASLRMYVCTCFFVGTAWNTRGLSVSQAYNCTLIVITGKPNQDMHPFDQFLETASASKCIYAI